MTERPEPPALEEAARLWGVQLGYRSQEDRPVRAPAEAALAALRLLGAPVEGPPDLPAAVRAGRLRRWAELVEPVAVCWSDGTPPAVEVRRLAAEADAPVRCHLVRENGTGEEWSVPGGSLDGLRAAEVEGREHVSGRLALPRDLEDGYHDLTVSVGPRRARVRVLRAPVRAWTQGERRDWGVFLPAYAIRSARSHGVADLGDLERLQRWTAARGGAVIGTLPLLAAFLDTPFDPSPYAPVSRLFWNELYLDPDRAPGLDRSERARRILESADYRTESARLRAAPAVDHRAAMTLRRRVLEALAGDLAPADAPLPADLAAHADGRPEAVEYAAFRAVGERERAPWGAWPAAPRAGSVTERDYDEAAFRYHLYAQWAMDRQLAAQCRSDRPGCEGLASLYMDLPLGAHADGFDVWRWRDLFADASAGAPPDAFFAAGQDWGFPPLHPARAREGRHAYWVATLRHMMAVSGTLRLDHVMSLSRLFWIPRGYGARDGVYVRYPCEELCAVLSLESHRHRTELVGENLGTVPPEVTEAMARHSLAPMYVVPFELDVEEEELAPVPTTAVASLGTHDMPPFRAFLEARDVDTRVAEGQLAPAAARDEAEERRRWAAALAGALGVADTDPRALLEAAAAWLGASSARLVLLSLEDLWLETEPQNRPGTLTGNWSRKARHALEELDGMDDVGRALEILERARADAGPRQGPRGATPAGGRDRTWR